MKIRHQLKVPVKSMAVINVARTEVLVEKVALGHLEILVIEVNFSVELAMHYSAGKCVDRGPIHSPIHKLNFNFILSKAECGQESQKSTCCGSNVYGCVGSTMSLNRKNLCKHKKNEAETICNHSSKSSLR